MRVALLLPGQGTVFAHGTLDLIRHSATAQALLDRACVGTGVDLVQILARDGGAGASTAVQQPLITAVCLGLFAQIADAGVAADVVAGHSLGELAAWSAAGGISPEQAVDLAVIRGRLMGRQAARYPGAMAVVKDGPAIADVLAVGGAHGRIHIAAYNAPEEWVITGDRAAIDAVARSFPVVLLPAMEGAWHSEHMVGAVAEYRRALAAATRSPLGARLICNHTGRPVADGAAVPELLAVQLTHPIRWVRTLHAAQEVGVDAFVTIGPGKVLRSFIRKTLGRRARVLATENRSALARTIEELTGETCVQAPAQARPRP